MFNYGQHTGMGRESCYMSVRSPQPCVKVVLAPQFGIKLNNCGGRDNANIFSPKSGKTKEKAHLCYCLDK